MTKNKIIQIIKTQQISSELNQITSPSVLSILRQLTETFAAAAAILFDRLNIHRIELNLIATESRWATVPWYVDAAKRFQYGFELSVNEYTQYYYDNNGLESSVIETSQLVKQAAVDFQNKRMIIKIAGIENNALTVLNDDVALAFTDYIEKIKRPGTPVTVYNLPADNLKLTFDIYFDGLQTESIVYERAKDAVNDYLVNLMFNGVLNIQELTNCLQKVPGVVDPFFISASTWNAFDTECDAIEFTQYKKAYSGYFRLIDNGLTLNMKRK